MHGTDHVAVRPSWDCGTCGDPWPCRPARQQMAQEMRPSEMALYCWANFEEAAGDLEHLTAMEMLGRFLNWHRAVPNA